MKRQRTWQLKMVAEGKCMTCSKPLNKYHHRCDKCHLKERFRQRRKSRCKPWTPGSRGRPPIGSNYEPRTISGKRYRAMKVKGITHVHPSKNQAD